MAHVFVSYKSEDEKKALDIARKLESSHIQCWIACRDISLGADYTNEIPQAIDNCQFFLLILSEKVLISPFVKMELKRAITKGKIILPIMIEEFALDDSYEFLLSNYQIYSFVVNAEDAFRSLLDRVVVKTDREQYAFVSCSHRDRERVLPIVQLLLEKGFRISYDASLAAGSSYDDEIMKQLAGSGVVLAFISRNYEASYACQVELNYTIRQDIMILPIYLDDPCDSSLYATRLGHIHSLFRFNYESDEAFAEHLAHVPALRSCRNS